jgi:hypothetical protein
MGKTEIKKEVKDNSLDQSLVKIRLNYDTIDPRIVKTSLKDSVKEFADTVMNAGKDAWVGWTEVIKAGEIIELPYDLAKPLLDETIELYPDFRGANSIDEVNKDALAATRVIKHRAELVE